MDNNQQIKRLTTEDVVNYINTNLVEINNIDIITIVPDSKKLNNEEQEIYQNNDLYKVLNIGDVERVKNLTPNLQLLFSNFNLIRLSVLNNLNYSENISISQNCVSFIASIFSCLRQNFNTININEQCRYIQQFFEILQINMTNGDFKYFGYDLIKWNKNIILQDLIKFDLTEYVMRYIMDYLHINIFILDINLDRLQYIGDDFIPYKKNIFILKHNYYEPIITEQSRFFTIGDSIIQHLINLKLVKIVEEDLNKYIDMTQFKLNSFCDDSDNDSDNNAQDSEIITFSETPNIDYINTAKKLSLKSKLPEIQDFARKLNISVNINNKKKTKQILLNDIQKYIDKK